MGLLEIFNITGRKVLITVVLLVFIYFGEVWEFGELTGAIAGVVLAYAIACLVVYAYEGAAGKRGVKVIAIDMGGVYMAGDYYTEEITPREGFPELVQALRTRYTVTVLSNQNAEAHALFEEKFKLNEMFDEQVVSGRVGLKKPDPRLFRHVADKFGVGLKQIVFIDDMPEFLGPAKRMGVKTIHFRSLEQMKAELVKYGVRF